MIGGLSETVLNAQDIIFSSSIFLTSPCLCVCVPSRLGRLTRAHADGVAFLSCIGVEQLSWAKKKILVKFDGERETKGSDVKG